jgi:hypothetical protein
MVEQLKLLDSISLQASVEEPDELEPDEPPQAVNKQTLLIDKILFNI